NGSTAWLFTNDELVALRLSGTKRRHLSARCTPTMGCAFRSRAGCTLPPRHRPNICVRYTCRELEAELAARGDRARIAALQAKLRGTFDEFCQELQLAYRKQEETAWSNLQKGA
ncbi:MAG: hypothetical protein ACM3ZE_20980, partial [Myxococcales bacterium]